LALARLSATGPAAAPTAASEYPERIRSALERLRNVCVEHGGKPGPVEPEVFCVGGFCTFEVYTWRGERLEAAAGRLGGGRTHRAHRQAPILTLQDEFRGKPKRKTRTVTYTFADGKMSGG
jgi:hypothetical protein